MAPFIPIDDPDDPRLEDYRDIRDRDLRGPSGRPGLFIVEAILPVEQMLSCPGVTRSVLIDPSWSERLASQLPDEVPAYVASFEIVRRVTGYRFHRGVLAVGNRAGIDDRALGDIVPRSGPATVLVCDGINNIDNIGLLFRNAAAFACDAVILSPSCHDPLYRKSVRVSIGHVLRIPWTRCTCWPEDLDRLGRELGFTLVGASTGDRARGLDEIEPPERVALVVGQEYRGLDPETSRRCDALVRIPMAPGVDSLNVAVATAVCLHRLSRGGRV